MFKNLQLATDMAQYNPTARFTQARQLTARLRGILHQHVAIDNQMQQARRQRARGELRQQRIETLRV